MIPVTWRRITQHNRRALQDDELLPFVVRSYGTDPTRWEVMDIDSLPWRTLKSGLASEALAKQFAQAMIEKLEASA